jgi:hypothetical protein
MSDVMELRPDLSTVVLVHWGDITVGTMKMLE